MSRSELDSSNLDYRTLTEFLTYLFISTGGRSAEAREALTEPGNSSVGGLDVKISEAEYEGWSAYSYNISTDSGNTIFYASREKPNIVLGTEDAEETFLYETELVEIREGVNLSMTEELLNLSKSSGKSSETSVEEDAKKATCPSTEGFDGENVRITDFALTDEGLAFKLINAAADPVKVNSVDVESGRAEFEGSTQIDVGSSGTVTVPGNFQEASSCNALDVEITYDVEGRIKGLKVSGTIEGKIALQ